MEEEVRIILRDAGGRAGHRDLVAFTRHCFASVGGVELELPAARPDARASGFRVILSFDSATARVYAERRRTGRPIGEADCQIAAISRSRGAVLVTRNVRDFDGAGLNVIDSRSAGP